MAQDANQKEAAVKQAEERRSKEAGKKGLKFGGTFTDMGQKDAVGVGQGK